MIDVGHMVGNYNVTSKLGEGGMGMVYLAEHPVIGSKVALKAIHPRFAQNVEVVSRFVNEAKLVNQIGHDHIVDITDFGHTPEGDFYFVMEYLHGQTLAAVIREVGPFAPGRAVAIAVQLADALQASHEHGVVHRDLKPENIFLVERDSAQDFVKVLDFGLAKLTNRDQGPVGHQTHAGWLMGTPFYMSPEQCEGRSEIDGRADIYALGVILFEMLTGFVPFGGRGFGEIILKHMATPPPTVLSIVPELPPALDAIVARALSKEPSRRFQSMADFRAALLAPDAYAASPAASDGRSHSKRRGLTPQPRSPSGQTLASAETKLERLAHSSPTPYGSVGEVMSTEDDPNLPLLPAEERLLPEMRRGRALGLFAAAIMTGIAVTILFGGHRPPALVAAAPLAIDHAPATVRLNVNSDPDGATVTTSSGAVLGVTPVSLEIPYGEAHVEYVVRKDGYLPRTTTVVPTISSAVFTILQKGGPAARSLDTVKSSAEARSRATARRAAQLETDGGVPPIPEDDDDVLELFVYR